MGSEGLTLRGKAKKLVFEMPQFFKPKKLHTKNARIKKRLYNKGLGDFLPQIF